jgi:hypothetical protein
MLPLLDLLRIDCFSLLLKGQQYLFPSLGQIVYIFGLLKQFTIIFNYRDFLHLPKLGEEMTDFLFSCSKWEMMDLEGMMALQSDFALDRFCELI